MQYSMRGLGRSGSMAALLFAAYALAPQAPVAKPDGLKDSTYLNSIVLAEPPAASVDPPAASQPLARDPTVGKTAAGNDSVSPATVRKPQPKARKDQTVHGPRGGRKPLRR